MIFFNLYNISGSYLDVLRSVFREKYFQKKEKNYFLKIICERIKLLFFNFISVKIVDYCKNYFKMSIKIVLCYLNLKNNIFFICKKF